MKPSTLLKTFSSKLSSRSSVAPWPPVRTQFDLWLTTELDHLRIHPSLYTTTAWLSKSLDTAIFAQEMVTNSIKQDQDVVNDKTKSGAFESYLDDTVDLLDACNVVRQRIGDIQTYANTVSIALHCLEGLHVHKPSDFAISRARTVLNSCTVAEKRCTDFDKCGSNLRKLGEKLASAHVHDKRDEILIGSRALALLIIAIANISLSLRSRWGIPIVHYSSSSSTNCWGSSILEMQREVKEEHEMRRRDGRAVLEELRIAISTTRRLRSMIDRKVEDGGEVRDLVRELRRRLEELEEGVRPLEEGVGRLYRGLVDVRMCLLRKISET